MNKYKELQEIHSKEMNSFPMAFAFSNKQFEEGMEKLGLSVDEKDCVLSIGSGGFIRKTDADCFTELRSKINNEMASEIENDKTGEGFIKDMFRYELNNHEYAYTYDVMDALNALGYTIEEVNSTPALSNGLMIAKREYLAACED